MFLPPQKGGDSLYLGGMLEVKDHFSPTPKKEGTWLLCNWAHRHRDLKATWGENIHIEGSGLRFDSNASTENHGFLEKASNKKRPQPGMIIGP